MLRKEIDYLNLGKLIIRFYAYSPVFPLKLTEYAEIVRNNANEIIEQRGRSC